MKIETVKIADIKPYRYNAKKHPDWHINQIIDSINEFGFNDPIAIDENNRVIEGHGRLKALQKMGRDTVEAIRLVGLTEEQKNAYTLVHNKLTMNTDFDLDTLQQELESILDIDMSIFSFDIDEITQQNEPDWEAPTHEENKEQTQFEKENILNLSYAQYEGTGKYDIPKILPTYKIPDVKEWIGFNYVMSDPNPAGKGVHFFIDDYQFERIWNRPNDYIEKLSQYAVVLAPDFSPFGDMPLATQIWNHYRKHWVARYWQEHGITVVPTIRASTDPRSMEWYLDGEPEESIVAYSSMWIRDDGKGLYDDGKKEWDTMIDALSPSKILVYGKKFDFMSGDLEVIPSFAQKRFTADNLTKE